MLLTRLLEFPLLDEILLLSLVLSFGFLKVFLFDFFQELLVLLFLSLKHILICHVGEHYQDKYTQESDVSD